MSARPLFGDDRGVSVAVTHALTLGLTTLFITLLLTSAGGLLTAETESSTEQSLETVGERLATEIHHVDQLDDGGNATVNADHPTQVGNSQYTVEALDRTECRETSLIADDTDNPCLELHASDVGVTTHVPIANETALETGNSTQGGTIEISSDGDEITMENTFI